MAIFIDVFYPGNKDRKARIDAVTADCGSMFASAATAKDEVTSKLATCDKLIKEAYANVAMTPPALKEVALGNAWAIYVPTVLLDAVASTVSVFALRWVWANGLARAGKIGAEKIAELGLKGAIEIAVPKWLRIFGEGGTAIVAAVLIDMLIDSISGAVQRDELQEGIHEITETRVGMKQTEMHNQALKTLLDAVIMSFNAIKSMQGISADIIDRMLKNLLAQNQMSRDSISRATAVAALKTLDTSRGSWTAEDGDWATKSAVNGVRLLAAVPTLYAPLPLEMVTCAVSSLPLSDGQRQTILTHAQALA